MSMETTGGIQPCRVNDETEAELLELYNQMIRVAYANVYNKSDAHDVVQEAWVRILQKRGTLRESSKLTAWAKTITRNIAINCNRSAARTRPFGQAWQPDERVPRRTEAELMVEISELLGSLEPAARTLLLYKFYYGMKDQEIAAAMDMPLGTVKAKIHRTRERLKAWNRDSEIVGEGG